MITIVTGKTGSWEDIQSRFIGEGWILKGLSKRSPKGWVEFSLGKGPGSWPGHAAEGTMCLSGWRNRVHMVESPGCLGGGRGLEEAHPVERPGALPLGHLSGLKCVHLHVGLVGCFLNSLDPFLLLGVWCLLSWLSLVLLSNCNFDPWPGCLFCYTPHRSCKRRSINTLFTVKLLGLIIWGLQSHVR